MDEYLEKLLSQIRCQKARPYIADEIRSHMESQLEDNLSGGMVYEEAERNAVADMGDPIAVGISLDRIHKPRIAWRLLIVVGIISLLGILIHYSVIYQNGYADLEPLMQEIYQLYAEDFVSVVVIGFIIMCVIYFVDYTMIAKYAKIIGLFIIAMGISAWVGLFAANVSGVHHTVGFGIFRVSATAVMLFYVPIYGAILYKYRDSGVKELIKAIIWLVVPVFITFKMPERVTAGIMLLCMLFQLTVAILKGWYRIPIKRTIAALWAVFMLMPVVLLCVMYRFHLLEVFQEERIRSFLTASGEGFYITSLLRTLCKDIALIGNSGNDVIGRLPEFNRDYIFAYILNSYGMIAGILIIAVLAALVMFVFGACIKQKNELGLVMGVGCGNIILINMIINLLSTVGVLPPVSSFLPFLSVGGDNIFLCYALVGIIMSIYRYKDVYPRHFKASQIILKKRFTLNM